MTLITHAATDDIKDSPRYPQQTSWLYAPKGKINIIMGRRIKSGKRKNVATRDVQDAADRNLGSSHIYAWRLCN
jgi:hypothetical protein